MRTWEPGCAELIGGSGLGGFLYLAASRDRAERLRNRLIHVSGGILGDVAATTPVRFASELVKSGHEFLETLGEVQREVVLAAIAHRLGARLNTLNTILDYPGTIHSAVSAITELRQAGVSPKDLQSAAQGEAAAYINDFVLLWEEYEGVRGVFLDTEDLYFAAVRSLRASDSPWGLIVVEGIPFTAGQLALLKELTARSKCVVVDYSRFRGASGSGVFREWICNVQRHVPNAVVVPPSVLESRREVFFELYPDVPVEVCEAMRWIKGRIDKGACPEDFEVVCPSNRVYFHNIRYYAVEFGIPVSLAVAESSSMFLRFIDALISGATWKRDEVIHLLKSPYLAAHMDFDADLIEQQALAAGITEGREEWRRLGKIPMVAGVLEILDSLLDFPTTATVGSFCQVLQSKIETAGCEVQVCEGAFSHGDFELLGRELRCLRSVEKLLEELPKMVELAGVAGPVSFQFFGRLFRTAKRSIQAEFSDGDGTVRVNTFSGFEAPNTRNVVVMGFTESQMSYAAQDDWLLRARIRKKLRERGFQVRERLGKSTDEIKQLAAAGLVRMSAPTLLEGEQQEVSGYLYLVGPVAKEEACGNGDLTCEIPLLGKTELLRRALKDENLLPHLTDEECRRVFLLKTRATGEMLRYSGAFGPEDGFLTSILRGEQVWESGVFSPSQLSEYGQCPFKFFCHHVLKLEALPELTADISRLERGTLLHQILHDFYAGFSGPVTWDTLDKARAFMTKVAQERFAAFETGGTHPLKWVLEKSEMIDALERFLEAEAEFAGKTGASFRPVLLEADFGVDSKPALEVDTGAGKIKIRGKVDRIDMGPEGLYILYDYKSSANPNLRDFRQGTDVQIPLYLQAVPMLLPEAGVPVAGLYYNLKNGTLSGIWNAEESKKLGVTPRSALSTEELRELLRVVNETVGTFAARIAGGDFRVQPEECREWCAYRSICRYEKNRIKLKNRQQ